jgi:hypothetical protein
MQIQNSNIVIYHADNSGQLIEVRLESEMVWLNRQQMAQLFGRDIKTIGKHINNALTEELAGFSTVANFAIVQQEGNRRVERLIDHYNLDVIISVGYRVKSKQGIQFRIWASQVLKNYLLNGFAFNNRIEHLERKVLNHDRQIESLIMQALPPKEGIFYDGQIFDAYKFVSDIVKTARKSIILIDNYVDESVLMLLAKRNNKVKATIYTEKLDKQLQCDIEKHNKQYPPVVVEVFKKSHDRFLIIDQSMVYHIGASLKDLGKRWFAFSKMEMSAGEILKHLIMDSSWQAKRQSRADS